ncbi:MULTISPECIES: protein adenylyltransferase SelO family protein [unclassified Sphingomonas]|uniref:protein adenylyltransferase SelO family protein n=1 Tax=unclassified Sphingomonas TaxID=196159 RepID=UPI0006F4C762|nr:MULTISPECIES: YdiU family protein [unclassified Sphingomonas]KQM57184.1 selenoprotein O [Sphingomonas sp. Leaf16]KQN10359.1 selenoprotein O [Sphingomonas sp. Leaf29]KQN18159.1 selenoprotein O [Sphingomonas sp. Leaf32]
MAENPQPARYRPRTDILGLGDPYYDAVTAATFPEHILRFRNDRAAAEVGIVPASRTPAQAGGQGQSEPQVADETLDPRLHRDTLPLTDAAWIDHFGRFTSLPGSLPEPLALRYHGHQFQSYNPDIGDGRGFLFAQVTDDRDRLLDLGTKGSGQTPYSRFGDGRLTLKGGVREVLATEMLEALNVPTSRSFSLIETGEALTRGDEPSPTRSAVLVRLNHSHVRIGTFQRLAYERDADAMRRLVDYVLTRLYARTPGSDPAIELFDEAVGRIATLAARFMAAGFVHGVLNTDNINLTGESFDYGPWRFAPTWDAEFTAAYFDHHGLYAYGRQPDAMHWNVMQLAVALRTVADAQPLIAVLETFPDRYARAAAEAVLWRLGVKSHSNDEDRALADAVTTALATARMSIDAFYHHAFGGWLPEGAEWTAFEEVRARLSDYRPRTDRTHPYWSDEAPCSMLIDEVEAIWAGIAESDDWSRFDAKVAAIRRMGAALT